MVVKLRDAEAVARAGASAVVEAAFKAIHDHGSFTVALAGGSTPRRSYELLADEFADQVDWRRVSFFFGDERCVAPDSPESNYRMAREALFDPLKLPPSAVRRMAGEIEPQNAAAEYDSEIRRLVGERETAFDLVLLGMGGEGHTASLFPGSAALGETSRLTVAVEVAAEPPRRLTLTPPALASTRQIVFLVTGEKKAAALADVFGGGEALPAAVVAGLAPSRFLVDEAAASRLPA